ncbi:hypothetical protein GEMRC1_004976 [Eukaryota sp. GEM-RC1]
MPFTLTNWDLLLDGEEFEKLRQDAVWNETKVNDIKSMKLHASEDTKIRAVYTCLFLGKSQSEVANFFWVHQSTISRWIHQFFNRDSLQRCSSRTSVLTESDGHFIQQVLEENPLQFLKEIRRLLATERGKLVSVSTIHRYLVEKQNFSSKKSKIAGEKSKNGITAAI